MSTTGDIIKAKRKQRGLSLRELSRESDMSHSYLSQLENGKKDSPSIEIVYKLSKVLGVRFIDLIPEHMKGE